MPIDQEFYYVAIARKDGSPPGLEKAFYSKIFLLEENAQKLANSVSKSIGLNIQAFRAIATWREK